MSAAYDPNYASVNEMKNTAFMGKGVVFNKYTGSRGKGGCNDANAEYIAELRRIMDEEHVVYQTAELGKVDQGGGGTIAYYLAQQLSAMRIKVKIVEKDKKRCELLCELLQDTLIINGDGTDRRLLMEEGLTDAESFVTLTNMDEENVFLALFAKENSKAKLVTKVNRIAFDELIGTLDLGSVIYPKYITADYILQYVRAMQNSIGSNVETLYHILDGKAEALEFSIQEESEVTGVSLMELKLKKNLLIGGINRNGKIHIPRGQDSILKGDTVIVVTTQKGLQDIRDILKK